MLNAGRGGGADGWRGAGGRPGRPGTPGRTGWREWRTVSCATNHCTDQTYHCPEFSVLQKLEKKTSQSTIWCTVIIWLQLTLAPIQCEKSVTLNSGHNSVYCRTVQDLYLS